MTLNVNGSLCEKLCCEDFVEKMRVYDIVLLSETWTDEFSNIDVSGFCAPYSKHRQKKKRAPVRVRICRNHSLRGKNRIFLNLISVQLLYTIEPLHCTK